MDKLLIDTNNGSSKVPQSGCKQIGGCIFILIIHLIDVISVHIDSSLLMSTEKS